MGHFVSTETASFQDALRYVAEAMDEGLVAPGWIYPHMMTWYVEEANPSTVKAEMAEIRSRLPRTTSWRKEYTDAYYSLKAEFFGIRFEITTPRNSVCERVVVGTELRSVPDPGYIAPPVPMVEESVDVVEWVCSD